MSATAEATKVLDTLAARVDALPVPLPARREDLAESQPTALPYVAWITPAKGAPRRLDIKPVTSKEAALREALLEGHRLFPGQPIHAMARPA